VSPDEGLVTAAAVFVGPILWLVWLVRMGQVQTLHRRGAVLLPIVLALVTSAALVYFVLVAAASFDVVGAPQYQFMYVALGLAWLRATVTLFPFVGLSPRDDVVERGNTAAAVATVGAILAVTLCYAGGNIGDGPGWWVVMFSAALATTTLIVAWAALAQLTPVTDAVTIDRDPAAGVRLGAMLVACGLILGRGVAGNWESAEATVADFIPSLLPVAAIMVVAIAAERAARPTPERPRAPLLAWGVLPAAVYLSIALSVVGRMGWPL
jgi:uncharacterized membrane protein YjfL (UPF0719 family)